MEPEKGKKVEKERNQGNEFLMDTPKRGPVATPISKFEDSPVFNYICNLSPLETGRPLRMSQSFNSYSFSSVPSIFTSPHVSNLKETKLLRRHSVSGSSNQEFSSEAGDKLCSKGEFVDVAQKSEEQKGSFDPGGCIDGSCNKGNAQNEVSQKQSYDYHGHKDGMLTCHGIDPKCVPSELGGSSNSVVPFGQEGPTSGFVNNREQSREDGNFGWVNISDAADFLIFESPDNNFQESFVKPLDSEIRLHISEETQADVLVRVEINESENTLFRNGEDQSNAVEATGDVSFNCHNNEASCLNTQAACLNNRANEVSNEVNANESACNLPRGVRRRCLVFDGGARKKFLDDGSSSNFPTLSKCHVTSNENQSTFSKPDHHSSRCIVPGIGLHLNALARSSNNFTANNPESLATQRHFINDLSSAEAPNPFANNLEIINQSLALNSVDRDVGSVDDGFRGTEDAYQLSGYLGSDDLNQGSPKKKKRKLESGGEESCKRCNCKKSKCLKLYCECFAAGVYCVEPCSCQDCFNKPIHEDTVLATRKQIESRNPLAFAPKVIRTTDFVPETTDDLSSTPASARHKRGCNCKKSGCLKKYCECYQGGVGCSINCRCEGCKNVFGRKEGSHIVLAEAASEETEMHQKSVVDRNSIKHIIENNTGQSPESTLPETPTHCGRTPQHPYSSKNKLPRSFLSTGSSSSALYCGKKFGMSAFSQNHTNFEKNVPTSSQDEEIPEILRSPISGIKSSSPNSKRVSPPHCEFGSPLSPARRKLILRSISSFPSLRD